MPTGVYTRTKEHKEHLEKLRLANIGNKHHLGHKHSQETKDKISKIHTGRKESKETRIKKSIALKGKNTWAKGGKLSKEHKKSISDANKGRVPWNKGKKMSKDTMEKMSKAIKKSYREGRRIAFCSQETREKISKSRKGKCSGSECHLWKGGITPENKKIRHSVEYKIWRKTVFLRDNFTCQKCNQHGGELNSHHINNFADFPELRMITENGITLCKKCHNKFHRKFGSKNNTKEQLVEFLNN